MKQVTINLYTFEELTPEVQKKVIKQNQDINIDPYWYTATEYEYTDKLKEDGWEDINMQFSGFGSQGDGASIAMNRTGIPKEFELSPNLEKHREEMNIKIERASYPHYVHANMIDAQITEPNIDLTDEEVNELGQLERDITSWARKLSNQLYKDLDREFYARTDDDAVKETLIENAYTFEENGTMRNE